jgi:hypothetical protein
MWRIVRIAVLLLVLAIAAYTTLYDRLSTTDWDRTLWIGVFPVDVGNSEVSARYIAELTPEHLADIEQFINTEAHRHGIAVTRPVRVDLYPAVNEAPPPRAPDAGSLSNIWWSLRMRLYARRNSHPAGRAPPQVRVFVLYHDPSFTQSVPHSVGLQKGLVGVVHAFASKDMTRSNNVVIAHEILHTLGATDKYDPVTLAPVFPAGYAQPAREPRYPQSRAEIMAGRYPVDAQTFEMPESLADVVVGDATAAEIRWIKAP